ncbi:MAG: YeiH family putative sulfate export transporter [Syntrophomonadaceae bacterium]|nr:YeiH family putative sulfate export transporter [Syntrophomonadaceae bacterium]
MKSLKLIPGIMVTLILALLSYALASLPIITYFNLSSLIIAILLGMLIGNLIKLPDLVKPGLTFSSKTILRLAIILLGFKLSFADVAQVGSKGLLIVLLTTTATLIFTLWIGNKLQLSHSLTMLIGAGTSICGASAIAAVAPIVKANEEDTAFGIAIITIFGTISMLLFPVIYNISNLPELLYAVWAGSSIHEVAQVVAAGFAAGETTGQFATIVKLSRVLLIIPVTIILGLIENKRNKATGTNELIIPWFVFGFLITIIINSLNLVPASIVDNLITLDGFLLTIAMAGIGLATNFQNMRKVGTKAFYAGLATSLFIVSFGFVLSSLMF